ncbi:MAG: sulfur carrier protein ThiS [Opitutales bacterium]
MQTIRIVANGERHAIDMGTQLPHFIQSHGLEMDRVVVELNGAALTRAEAREVVLSEGDRLEIVRVVAGG